MPGTDAGDRKAEPSLCFSAHRSRPTDIPVTRPAEALPVASVVWFSVWPHGSRAAQSRLGLAFVGDAGWDHDHIAGMQIDDGSAIGAKRAMVRSW